MQERRFNPPPKPSTPVEAPWREVEQILVGIKAIVDRLEVIIGKPGGNGGTGAVTINLPTGTTYSLVPNLPTIITGQHIVQAAGVPEQLENILIPAGYPVTLIAKPGNSGYIYIGPDKGSASDTQRRFDALQPGIAIQLHITDLSALWIDADNDLDGVAWIIEASK